MLTSVSQSRRYAHAFPSQRRVASSRSRVPMESFSFCSITVNEADLPFPRARKKQKIPRRAPPPNRTIGFRIHIVPGLLCAAHPSKTTPSSENGIRRIPACARARAPLFPSPLLLRSDACVRVCVYICVALFAQRVLMPMDCLRSPGIDAPADAESAFTTYLPSSFLGWTPAM